MRLTFFMFSTKLLKLVCKEGECTGQVPSPFRSPMLIMVDMNTANMKLQERSHRVVHICGPCIRDKLSKHCTQPSNVLQKYTKGVVRITSGQCPNQTMLPSHD